VSNKKRIVIYNYLNDIQHKNQKYYLDQYDSKEPNDTLRYLKTNCENYNDPLAIKEVTEGQNVNVACTCGKFYVSSQKPLSLAYLQTSYKEGKRKIWLYHEKLGIYKDF
jgi:hypothetical protein